MDGILDSILADLKRSLDDRYRPDPDNYFGDVGNDFGYKYSGVTEPSEQFPNGQAYSQDTFDIAKGILSNTGNVTYDMMPDGMKDGIMAPVNRGISVGADLGLAGLMGLLGLTEKAVGYGSEILAGPTNREKLLARDIMAGLEILGAGTGAGHLSAMRSHFAPYAAKRVSRINVPSVTPDNRAGILGFLDDYRSEMHRELNRGR
jgi:hypothetical protein